MRKAREKPVKEEVDYSYLGKPLVPDLLDYRYMDLYMNRQADTGKIGCLGTFTMALTLLSCGFVLSLLILSLR